MFSTRSLVDLKRSRRCTSTTARAPATAFLNAEIGILASSSTARRRACSTAAGSSAGSYTHTDASCSRGHTCEGSDRDQPADHSSRPKGGECARDDPCACQACRGRGCHPHCCKRKEWEAAAYEHGSSGESRLLHGVLAGFDPFTHRLGEVRVADSSVTFANQIECCEESSVPVLVTDLDVERVERW
jgi:hypothetical protein